MYTSQKVNVTLLQAHHLNQQIYGDEPVDEQLTEAMRLHGLLHPLLVTSGWRVLSGHRRLQAAKQLGWSEIDVQIVEAECEADELLILLSSNCQRQKTNWQLCQEAKYLRQAAREHARLRQSEAAKGNSIPTGTKGQSRDKVGRLLQISGRQADHLVRLADFFDHCSESGDQEIHDEVKSLLEKSVRAARSHPAVKDYLRRANQKGAPKPLADLSILSDESSPFIKLEVWNKQDEDERRLRLRTIGTTPMNPAGASIEWAAWSWNPVTGCLHNCPYCYARDTAERHYDQGFAPSLVPAALSKPKNTSVIPGGSVRERNVFTCSMADLFGNWVPREWIDMVFAAMRESPEWNFLTLTKFPQRLHELDVPDNCWMGASLDVQSRLEMTVRSFEKLRSTNPGIKTWLSLEPLLEPLRFDSLAMFDWIVIGGASRSSCTPAFTPPSAWYEAILEVARRDGCRVFVKQNLQYRPQELPGEFPEPLDRAPDEFFVGRKTIDTDGE